MRGEFLASTDERFRPVNLSLAPDGTLYVVDMYRGIIQHKGYMTEYLRDYVLTHKLDEANYFGRIYRIVHESTRRDTSAFPARGPAANLVPVLAHPNGWRATWRSSCWSSAETHLLFPQCARWLRQRKTRGRC